MILKTALLLTNLISAFEYRVGDPSSLFPYEVASREKIFSYNQSNPAYLSDYNGASLSYGYTNPYSMKGFNYNSINFIYSNGKSGFSSAITTYGIKEYKEETYNLSSGVNFNSLSMGIRAHFNRIVINDSEVNTSLSLYDFDSSARIELTDQISLGVRTNNISSYFGSRNGDILSPETSAGVTYSPHSGIFLSYNCNKMRNGYISSFVVSTNLLPVLNLSMGYSRETTEMAFSANLFLKDFRISYGARYHNYLGYSHMVAISYSTRSHRLESIKYLNPILREESYSFVPVDIQKADLDTLKTIPELRELSAERIAAYRKIFGPITNKALYQLGLSTGEIKSVKVNTYGLAKKSKRKSRYNKQRKKHKRVKNLFTTLVNSGVNPTRALIICQKKKSLSPANFKKFLKGDKSISGKLKGVLLK